MSTTHHPHDTNNHVHPDHQRPARCLRHHVWMAACPDCCDARVPRPRVSADR